jgi:hypothetical protein
VDLPAEEGLMKQGGQVRRAEDLTEHNLARARIREEHLLEVETGYRSGSRFWARPDEPRPAFDPAWTTLTERRLAKVAELNDLDGREAMQLGLERISVRTLKRMSAQHSEHGVAGLADGRWTARGLGTVPSRRKWRRRSWRCTRSHCTARG